MVVAAKALKNKISYEEYLQMPEINLRYEIIDGEMIMPSSPTFDHQWIIHNILDALRPFVKKKKLGAVVAAPLDILIRRMPLRTRQPDILYISFKRGGKTISELRQLQLVEIAPDLAIEILSPSDRRSVLKEKLEDYVSIGVLECWLVSPQAETIEILKLSSEGATTLNLYGSTETLRSEVLPDFKMKVADVFSDY
ncbi:MAG: Uma2 family endonuclease [Blastocatellia bacterium]